MTKSLSVIIIFLIICVTSYGQVRVASSTKVTDPLVYTSAQIDALLKTTDSIYFDGKWFIVPKNQKLVTLNTDSIVKYLVKPSVDSLGKLMAAGFAASNARQDSIVKAFNGLNSAVWASNKAMGIRLDSLNTELNIFKVKTGVDILGLTNRMAQIENTSINLNTRLTKAEGDIISINGKISLIQIQVKNIPTTATTTTISTSTTILSQ